MVLFNPYIINVHFNELFILFCINALCFKSVLRRQKKATLKIIFQILRIVNDKIIRNFFKFKIKYYKLVYKTKRTISVVWNDIIQIKSF